MFLQTIRINAKGLHFILKILNKVSLSKTQGPNCMLTTLPLTYTSQMKLTGLFQQSKLMCSRIL